MAAANFFTHRKEDLYETVFSELKNLGVKVPKVKKFKSIILKKEASLSEKGCKIFGASLSEQEWTSDGEIPLPRFIALTTAYLQKYSNKEIGLFRKAGNVARQRKLRAKLEKGESLQDSDPNDVAALLKQWLRELPEPLIPSYLQDLFIRCQNLDSERKSTSACLFTCLLLPPKHFHTFKHLLCFLSGIALNSDRNRMGSYNLALIMAPNIFASNTPVEKSRSNLIYQHTAILKILIENADKIGELPRVTFHQSLHCLELNSSIDNLDGNTKSKRKIKGGTVQDIFSGFKKLVGQNGTPFSTKNPSEGDLLKTPLHQRCASKRKAEPDVLSLSETKKKKQVLSLGNLDDHSLTITPKSRGFFLSTEKNSNRHTRRKSFGALLLRRKEKKRSDKQIPLPQEPASFDVARLQKEEPPKESQGTYLKYASPEFNEIKFQFSNLNINGSTPLVEEKSNSIKPLAEPKKTTTNQLPPSAFSTAPSIKYSKSCRSRIENKPLAVTPLPLSRPLQTSTSFAKSAKMVVPSHRAGLTRQQAFNKQPAINSSCSTTRDEINRKENEQNSLNIRSRGSIKHNTVCLHSQKSSCNTKCDKNKNGIDRKVSERRTNEVELQRKRPSSLRSGPSSKLSIISSKELPRLPKVPSHSSLSLANPSVTLSEGNKCSDGHQNLDLSLSVMLQNFCLSPPNESQEIKLSIGITSIKKNPELKVNLSQKEGRRQKDASAPKTSGNKTSDPKNRKRLSSNSDSRIPRLKKLPVPSRPNSFSGNLAGGRHRVVKAETSSESAVALPVKIAVMPEENESPGPSVEDQSINDSCFKTPNSSLSSVSWMNGTKYLSALSTPSEEMFCKRESIGQILRDKPGHVQSKVSLYDSKIQSTSSSNCSSTKSDVEGYKFLRSSSEKSRHGYQRNRPALSSTSSYESGGRGGSVRSRQQKTLPPLPKFTLTDLDTPSPNKYPSAKTQKTNLVIKEESPNVISKSDNIF